jgi:SGNH domain (fused to AT3 domains)
LAFVADACPPVLGLANTLAPTCRAETHNDILARIEALHGVTDVVITGNFEGAIKARNVTIDGGKTSYAGVREKLSTVVMRLHAMGARVVVLEQGPTYAEDVSNYLMQNLRHGHLEPLAVDRSAHVRSVKDSRDLADVVDLYIETTDLFCNEVACPSVDDEGQLVIFDRNHVTREYSARLARLLAGTANF